MPQKCLLITVQLTGEMLFATGISILFAVCSAEYPDEIFGPTSLGSSIAIVGADVAGIHMALRLKEKGFINVVVYEQSNQIAALTSQVTHRGTVFDSPFDFQTTDKTLKSLVERFMNNADIEQSPVNTVWAPSGGNLLGLKETTMLAYVIGETKNFLKTDNDTIARRAIVSSIQNLLLSYAQNFPNSNEFISEPNWMAKANTYGSIKDFLTRNNLNILEPLLYFTFSRNGLGSIEDTPAFYLFMHLNIKHWEGLQRTFQNGVLDPDVQKLYLVNGFNQIWSRIVSNEGINVVLNSRVVRLRRPRPSADTESFLTIRRPDNTVYTEKYDFVIWAGSLRGALTAMNWKNDGVNAGPFMEEYQNFQRIHTNLYKTTVLADTELLDRGATPINIFINNVKEQESGPYIMTDNYALSQRQTNQNAYRNGSYPQNADGSPYRTVQLTYYTKTPFGNIQNQFNQIQLQFTPVNVTFASFISKAVNPQFSQPDITNSMIFKILKMQGSHGMWYIGSSVTLDNTEALIKYNELLISKMRAPIPDGNKPEAK